jgi:hypothetical protein
LNGVRCGADLPRQVELTRRDAAVAERVIVERLALAGARLAWILNRRLGDRAAGPGGRAPPGS